MSLANSERDAAGGASVDDAAIRLKRALYRAQHRGTKEMDWMIGRFGEARLPAMATSELDIFERFLEAADPEINTWLLDPAACPEPRFESLIQDIRAFHSLT